MRRSPSVTSPSRPLSSPSCFNLCSLTYARTKSKVEFVKLEECHHFMSHFCDIFTLVRTWWEFLIVIQVHWDDPEKLVRVLVENA